MALLERSNSKRLRKKSRREQDDDATTRAPRRDNAFDAISEGVEEHRKSLAKRPSTSGGADQTDLNDAHIAAGQDEMALRCSDDLRKAGQTVEIRLQDGLDTFQFPTPSPRILPRSANTATFRHNSSPLFRATPRLGESPQIGVAIGSPSHAPPGWGRSVTADHVSQRIKKDMPNRVPPAAPTTEHIVGLDANPEHSKKKSSWRVFGALFRKSKKQDTSQCKAGPNFADMVEPTRACSPQMRGRSPAIMSSDAQQSPRPVPTAKAGSRASSLGRIDARAQANRTSFMPAVKAEQMRKGDIKASAMSPPQLTLPRTPRLDLDLPAAEFDRYSVMFEKLLAGEGRPSILERRQSRLVGKPLFSHMGEARLSDHAANATSQRVVPQRSLTSPRLTPRLSIVVDGSKENRRSAQPVVTALYHPRPVVRSNTDPSTATPSLTAGFASREREATNGSSEHSPESAACSDTTGPPTPTTLTTTYTDSGSLRRGFEQHQPVLDPIKSQDILTPDSPELLDETVSLYPRVRSPQDLERQMVQVSVARQVSVSRARMKVQRAASTKQPLRPRVVELSKNRKSTAGVLEGLDDNATPLPQTRKSVVGIIESVADEEHPDLPFVAGEVPPSTAEVT